MAGTRWRRVRGAAVAVLLLGLSTSCARPIAGSGSVRPVSLQVQGGAGTAFDRQARAALEDVIGFWSAAYPAIDHGRLLPALRGKLYSVDGDAVISTGTTPPSAASNKCLAQKLTFIIDNAAYCQLDDSIIWDRSPRHLLPVLATAYGPALTALVFAHEFGHAVQLRLGIDKQNVRPIDLESQADCAAGAFAAAALAGDAPHFHITSADLDRALDGFLQVRDSTPDSPGGISHGDGFDRLNALQQGIQGGAPYCFSSSFLRNRSYTERGYVDDGDYASGGNEPLAAVLAPSDSLATDLNRFWTAAGKAVNKTFTAVKLVQAAHPACGADSPASEFGYCPSDNTVYYSAAFAKRAYYSITFPNVAPDTGNVTLVKNQPGDFALGSLVSVAWGMAARRQLFGTSTDDKAGLVAAICYAGAYADDINRQSSDAAHPFILSPADMDEATSAVLNIVGLDQAFGARATTGLHRVQAFVKGYTDGLHAC